MTVSFISGNTHYLLIVQRPALERRDPTIVADPKIMGSKRKNIGLDTFEDGQRYSERQSRQRRVAWKRLGR